MALAACFAVWPDSAVDRRRTLDAAMQTATFVLAAPLAPKGPTSACITPKTRSRTASTVSEQGEGLPECVPGQRRWRWRWRRWRVWAGEEVATAPAACVNTWSPCRSTRLCRRASLRRGDQGGQGAEHVREVAARLQCAEEHAAHLALLGVEELLLQVPGRGGRQKSTRERARGVSVSSVSACAYGGRRRSSANNHRTVRHNRWRAECIVFPLTTALATSSSTHFAS